jgi:hypothetical protein
MEFKTHGESNQEDSVMEAVVKSRNGSVLGKRSILKMYFFPGQKTTSDHAPIPGAPHVCKVCLVSWLLSTFWLFTKLADCV